MTPIHSKDFGSPLSLPASDQSDWTAPTEIQWMPPGEHTIHAFQGDQRVTRTVRVTAKTAERMQQLLQEIRSKAASGSEDLPYIDFNHDDSAAAGFITAFRWAGEDPVTGGIRATIEWTAPGKAALQGRAYRRFSPSFTANADGEVTGAPLNMGGLVNRAAFKTIHPIVAGAAGTNQADTSPMDSQDQLAANLAAAQQKIIDLTAQLASAKGDRTIAAKDAEITALKDKIEAYETAEAERVKVDAKSAIADAVAAGKIPPQDKELQAHYEAVFAANPAAGKVILAKLPVAAALGGQITSGQNGATKTLTPAEVWNAALKAKETAAAAATAK